MWSLIILSHVFAANLIELPQGCLATNVLPCSVKSEKSASIKKEGVEVYLQANTFLRFTKVGLEFIKGNARFCGNHKILSAFADFQCSDCVMQLKSIDKQMNFSLYEGKADYKTVRMQDWQAFPKYNKVLLSPLQVEANQNEEEVLQALNWQDYVSELFSFTKLKTDFMAKKDFYDKALRNQRFISSQIYHDAVINQMAAKQQREENDAVKRKQWQKERLKLRSVYQKRMYLED